MGCLVLQDIRTEQKLWSGKAGCALRDCCYLPNNIASIDCLVAAGIDGSLYTCSHQEDTGAPFEFCSLQERPGL